MEEKLSNFHFPLDLVQKPPIRCLGDDLVGRRLDHAELTEPQRTETAWSSSAS